MSHGTENGILYTDYVKQRGQNINIRAKGTTVSSMNAFESYTTKEVFNALRNNPYLKKCHKVVVIQVKSANACDACLKHDNII